MGTIDIAAKDSVEIDLGEDRRPGESDQQAIEWALAKIASAGAGTLYLPPRRYTLCRPLVVAGAYVTIVGDPGTIVHLHLGLHCDVDTEAHVFALSGDIRRACFRGLTIIGPSGDPTAGRAAALSGRERGACIGTAEGAVVHSLVVEDCVLSDRIVGVWLRFKQTVRGPFRFRRNRIRRVVRGLEVSTEGGTTWSGTTARDVRFERNHILVGRGNAEDSRALTTVATLDVRLWANTLSGAGMAFEQASPWFDALKPLSPSPPESAPEFPSELLEDAGLDTARALDLELRHRIQTRYNFMSLTLSQTHDLSYNVFDGRRQGDERKPWDENKGVALVVELAHTYPIATGNLIAHYEAGRYFVVKVESPGAGLLVDPPGAPRPPLSAGGGVPGHVAPVATTPISFHGITTRRRGLTATGNVVWDLQPAGDTGMGAFTFSPGAARRDAAFPRTDTRASNVVAASLVEGCNRFLGVNGPYVPSEPPNDSLVAGANLASQLAKEAVSVNGWRTVNLAGSIFREAYQNPVGTGRDAFAAVELSGCASVSFATRAVTQPPRLPSDRGFSRPVNSSAGSELTLRANFFANGNPQANQKQEEVSPPAGLGPPVFETPLARIVGATLGLEAENVLTYFNSTYELKESTQTLPIVTGETP